MSPFTKLTTVASLAILVAGSTASPALACVNNLRTGLVGITAEQSVRINAVSTEAVDPTDPSLEIPMTFYGADGGVLAETRGRLRPMESLYLEKRATELFARLRAGERRYLRAEAAGELIEDARGVHRLSTSTV